MVGVGIGTRQVAGLRLDKMIQSIYKFIREQQIKHAQFVRFCLVGFLNTFIYLLIYYAVVYFSDGNYILANIIGWALSVLSAWYLSRIYTFKGSNARALSSMVKSYTIYGSSAVIGTYLLYLLVEFARVPVVLAPYFVIAFNIPYNYLLHKYWAFRKTTPKAQ